MSDNYEIENDLEQTESEEEFDEDEISPKTRRIKSGIRFARAVILLVMAVTAGFLPSLLKVT